MRLGSTRPPEEDGDPGHPALAELPGMLLSRSALRAGPLARCQGRGQVVQGEAPGQVHPGVPRAARGAPGRLSTSLSASW
eukprot:15432298-Alexandrium_andersonii.AAC.1